MKPETLKQARLLRGWSQTEAANRLGVSQSYLAMLEYGERRVTPKLARSMMRVYRLPPTVLPLPGQLQTTRTDNQALAETLAALGYPGFAYLRPHRWKKNPAEVLLTALLQQDLEARVVEALPWLLLQYWNMDLDWLVEQAKRFDLQNRLGFVATLAREVAARLQPHHSPRNARLRQLEAALEKSKLAREDTLNQVSTQREHEWLLQHRTREAAHWNLLTPWSPDMLRYVNV